jgi:hypothetical protein
VARPSAEAARDRTPNALSGRNETRRLHASARRPWIAAAALILLVGTACTDRPEATDEAASPPPAADPGAKANPPSRQEQARIPLDTPAEPSARAGAQDPEPRQQRFAKLREDRYADLGLSDEQKRSIEVLRAEQQTWIAEHRDEIRALGNKREAAWQAGDEAEAEAIRLQLRELRETLPAEHDIVAVLTDEQRAQLRKNRPITLKERPSQRQAPPAQASDAAPPPS